MIVLNNGLLLAYVWLRVWSYLYLYVSVRNLGVSHGTSNKSAQSESRPVFVQDRADFHFPSNQKTTIDTVQRCWKKKIVKQD